MSRDFPGRRLYEALSRTLDPTIVQSVVTPTFADLHYEVQRAGAHRWQRWLSYLRCYVALSRAFAFGRVIPEGLMPRLAAVVLLGVLGAGSMWGVMWLDIRPAPIQLLPFFVMAVVTPLVLRSLKRGRTYKGTFFDCTCISLFMMLPLVIYLPQLGRVPWWVALRGLAILGACIAFAAALIAAVAWKPSGAERPVYHPALLTLLTGACVFALAAGGTRFWFARGPMNILLNMAASAYSGFILPSWRRSSTCPLFSRCIGR